MSKCVTSNCISTCSCWIGWTCVDTSLWSCSFLWNWKCVQGSIVAWWLALLPHRMVWFISVGRLQAPAFAPTAQTLPVSQSLLRPWFRSWRRDRWTTCLSPGSDLGQRSNASPCLSTFFRSGCGQGLLCSFKVKSSSCQGRLPVK